MLAWLGGKQKLVDKAKATQRARAAAAATGGSSGGASTAAAAPRPNKRRAAAEQEQAAVPPHGALIGPATAGNGRPPLAPAPANQEPRRPQLKRVKASLDLLALQMPAWEPAADQGAGDVEAHDAPEVQHQPAAAMEWQ